ncbi:hypothetical protein JXJ21_12125 [candidate division KSB1 bacterium]|nr:hypothetical protein [candidate division KSB1 bacterium]
MMPGDLGILVSIIGTVLTLISLAIAIYQIYKTRSAAEATKKSLEIVKKNVLQITITECISKIDQIVYRIRRGSFEDASHKTNELTQNLSQLKALVRDNGEKIHQTLQPHIVKVRIIREELERKLENKRYKLNIVKINKDLFELADVLKEFLEKIKFKLIP